MFYDGCNSIEFIKSKHYKKMNLKNQRRFIFSLFHIVNFSKIKNTERIILLQELENNIAISMKREPYSIELNNDPNLLLQFGTLISKKKIYVDKPFIEEGKIKNYTRDEGLFLEESKCLNLELLDGMFHEQHHIYLDKIGDAIDNEELKPVREYYEYLLWLIQLPEDHDFQKEVEECYYSYRMAPQEYYAFKYAEEQIKDIFVSLEGIYGYDPNLKEYLSVNLAYRNYVCNLYNEDHHELYGYDELYQVYVSNYIKKVSERPNFSEEDLFKELKGYLPFTSKYKKKINRCLN